VERASAVASFNDCWLVLGFLIAFSLAALPLLRVPPPRKAELG